GLIIDSPRLRTGGVIAGSLIALGWMINAQPAFARKANLFNLVFLDVLKHSPDPRGDMQLMKIDEKQTPLIGRSFYDADLTKQQRDALDGKDHSVLLRLYVHRPLRAIMQIRRAMNSSHNLRQKWYYAGVDPGMPKGSPWGLWKRDSS